MEAISPPTERLAGALAVGDDGGGDVAATRGWVDVVVAAALDLAPKVVRGWIDDDCCCCCDAVALGVLVGVLLDMIACDEVSIVAGLGPFNESCS